MKKLKKINKQAIIRKLLYVVVFIIGTYLLVGLYSLIFEQDKLAIDRYNFGQLEKVKLGLKDIPREQYKFRNFIEFDNKYANLGIKPKNNCYYMVSTNYFDDYDNKQGIGYIFGFRLESLIYKLRYFSRYYAYPKYDLAYNQICFGGPGSDGICYDRRKANFNATISNPCED